MMNFGSKHPANKSSINTHLHREALALPAEKVWKIGAFTLMLVFWHACQSPPPEPVEITENDTCAACKMPIRETKYAAEFITKDGFARKFDDIACMIDYAKTKFNRNGIAAYFLVDYATKEWIRSEEAIFARSERIGTPQNGGILAFKSKTTAEGVAAEYQAELLGFDELIK